MLYVFAVLMLIIAFVLLQIARKRSEATATRQPAETKDVESRQFASVQLRCDRHACVPAQGMRDKVFLASEAPTLPLPTCDATHCQCKYAKADDRRGTDGRRAVDLGIQPLIFDGVEHRQDDRRAS